MVKDIKSCVSFADVAETKKNPIRDLDAQIGVRLFNCKWRLSCCGAVLLVDDDLGHFSSGFQLCPDYLKYPRNHFWEAWFPDYSKEPDKVINRLKEKYPETTVEIKEDEGVFVATVNEKYFAKHKDKGVAICLATLKFLVCEKK